MITMKEQILQYLPEEYPWRDRIHYFDTIDSTNTRAKQIAAQGAPHGTVLIADHQSLGRGRMGRSFQSPGGVGVYMSLLLRPQCTPGELMHLTCATAVAACDAVQSVTGVRPGIKWTNDLVCGGRKIAGILTELVCVGDQWCAIVGIGINCCQKEADFSEEIRSMAGSLAMVTGQEICRPQIAAALMAELAAMDQELLTGTATMLQHYRSDCITLGREISILRGDEVYYGWAEDINEEGALIVRYADGRREAVASGEVSVRGMYGYIS